MILKTTSFLIAVIAQLWKCKGFLLFIGIIFGVLFAHDSGASVCQGVYYPPPGKQSLSYQKKKAAVEVGLKTTTVSALKNAIKKGRWALWREGYLVHVQASAAFNTNTEIASARKAFHAATIGGLIQLGKIYSLSQKVSDWNAGNSGGPGNCHQNATLYDVMTRTTAYDDQSKCPGEVWAYSDANPPMLNQVAARAWRGALSTDFTSNYQEVIGGALLNPIGASGWYTTVKPDGIRLNMYLEDFGRFGLLMSKGGLWDGTRVIPEWFVYDQTTKQTYSVAPNYDNWNDGDLSLTTEQFPESPYGFMTWVNTDRDLVPNIASTWAYTEGAWGNFVIWDSQSGVVLAIQSSQYQFYPLDPVVPIRAVITVLQNSIAGPNPLLCF